MEAKTEDVYHNVYQLDKDAGSGPWAQNPVAADEMRIDKVFGSKRKNMLDESCNIGETVGENQNQENTACGTSIGLGNIHI